MLKQIFVILAAIAVAFAIFVTTRPDSFRVERSAQVAAAPTVIHAALSDFHRWADWSPWEKLDPTMKKEYSGPAAGTGASYHWVGNDKVGEGRMTITESVPGDHVTIRLEFIKPWEATNTTVFQLTPDGTSTRVSWRMEGKNGFMAKAFSVFMNMDAMIGKDFEQGLAALREITEADAKRIAIPDMEPTAAAAPASAP